MACSSRREEAPSYLSPMQQGNMEPPRVGCYGGYEISRLAIRAPCSVEAHGAYLRCWPRLFAAGRLGRFGGQRRRRTQSDGSWGEFPKIHPSQNPAYFAPTRSTRPLCEHPRLLQEPLTLVLMSFGPTTANRLSLVGLEHRSPAARCN